MGTFGLREGVRWLVRCIAWSCTVMLTFLVLWADMANKWQRTSSEWGGEQEGPARFAASI